MINKKVIGCLFFGLACCMWILPFCLGFIDLPNTQKAVLLTVVVVLGEVFFVLSIIFLGKPFWEKIKWKTRLYWRFFITKLKPKRKP
jgi:hypothetical protein